MRHLALLLCFFYYHMLLLSKPVYAADECPSEQVKMNIKAKFSFDRVDSFARADTATATIQLFPATSEQSLCRNPNHEIWIRKANSENWFEVRFDKRGKQVGVSPK